MKTILVIDDKKEVRENIVEILELAQYAVVEASNGKQGLEQVRLARPDLILCDIMMPELDGYGMLHILRNDPVTAVIPFIFLTARIEPVDFRNGMNMGADDYMTKPFDDVTLLSAVELRLKKNEQRRRQVSPDGLTILLSAINNSDGTTRYDGYPTIRYPKKQLLLVEGNFPTALYFIRRGQFKRYKTDSQGNELITGLLGEGDFVGYTALLAGTAYQESAEVLADAEVCTIPKVDFLALINHNSDLANHFIRLMTVDLDERDERMLKLAYQPVRKRVAEALLLVQRKFYPGSPPDGGGQAGIPASFNQSHAMALARENWAHLVGASVETIIRTLSDLRAEGLIELSGSQVTILDLDRLSRLKH